ncbi:MAG: thiamine biosynthesis protein [Candidatus Krumholzibacteriota bacterium]|nr:thiamine biosynthesis protein [Candidatus Krumholzibacteriota bacterium]
MERTPYAIGMISGGLDSLLATLVLARTGARIEGLHFLNGFAQGSMKGRVYHGKSIGDIADEKEKELSALFGINVSVIDVSEEFLGLLSSPKHGFGKNINPCVDCRIFLLKKARDIMISRKADLIYTGEVVGQRPMSQHLSAMRTVEKESGLEGLLLRPLSARLLPPTDAEKSGLIDRELLLDIQGRTRRRQMELVEELKIDQYQSPAGGCVLTDENYAKKFIDYTRHNGGSRLTVEDTVLLSTGRHLRLSPRTKIVVGRNQEENEYIESKWKDSLLAAAVDFPGPTVLVQGDPDDEDILAAASVTARYGKGNGEDSVRVSFRTGGEEMIVEVRPARDDDLKKFHILSG